MKNNLVIKLLSLFFLYSLYPTFMYCWSSFTSPVSGVDTHKPLIQQSIDLVSKKVDKYGFKDITDEKYYDSNVIKGAGAETDSHIYISLNGGDTDSIWRNRVRAKYKDFSFPDTYYAMGNICHLIEDQAVPAHGANIKHGIPADKLEMEACQIIAQIDACRKINTKYKYPPEYYDTLIKTTWDNCEKWKDKYGDNKDTLFWKHNSGPGAADLGQYGGPKNKDIFVDFNAGLIITGQFNNAVSYTAGALIAASKALPPLIKEKDFKISGAPADCPVFKKGDPININFYVMENRTKDVDLLIGIDGDPKLVKVLTLDEGDALPWESQCEYAIATASLKAGDHILNVLIRDKDKNDSDKIQKKFKITDSVETTVQAVRTKWGLPVAFQPTRYSKMMPNWGQIYKYDLQLGTTIYSCGKSKDQLVELFIGKKIPVDMINDKTEISFRILPDKCGGGANVSISGGPMASPFTGHNSDDEICIAIRLYDKNGKVKKIPAKLNKYGQTGLSEDVISNAIIVPAYIYMEGEYNVAAVWIKKPDSEDGYYKGTLTGKNPNYKPPTGEIKVNILKQIADNNISLTNVSSIMIGFWGQNHHAIEFQKGILETASDDSYAVMPSVPSRYFTIAFSPSNSIDFNPMSKTKTQKITIKKKKTSKKAEQLASRAPALETGENTEESVNETDEETDSDLGMYYAGDTVVVEGETASDSEGGNIQCVWCRCDAGNSESSEAPWQPVAAVDGAYDSASEAFRCEYTLPDGLPEGTYSIELKSVNGLGEEDAEYATLYFAAGGELNERSTYISSASSASLRILPASGEIKLEIPANTFSDDVTLALSTVTPASTSASTIKVSDIGFEIVNDKGLQPQKEIAVSIKYRDGDITALEEQKLMLGWYDEAHSRWVALPAKVDAENNKITSSIKHLSKFGMIQLAAATDLSNVIIYPNPYKPGKHPQGLIIDNLTLTAEIKIYTITGELVKNVAYTTQNGRASWNGTNEYGNDVASGIYVAYIKSDTGTKKIKFAIQR